MAAGVAAVVQTLGVVAACFGVIAAVGKVLKTVNWVRHEFVKVIQRIARSSRAPPQGEGAMALVGLGIGLAMNVASFLIQWLVGGMRLGSAVSTLAASVTVTLIFFFLFTALGAIGSLIQSVIGLVDILVGLICNAAGVTAEKNAMAYKWACGGITGALVNGIKALFYAGNVMVDMKDPDRLQTGNFQLPAGGPTGTTRL